MDLLIKLMFKGILIKIEEILVAKIRNVRMQDYKEYTAKTLKIQACINNIIVNIILNTSIKVNVIIKALANKARLTV